MDLSQLNPLRLCWKDRIAGTVTDIGLADFPWAGGRLTVETEDPDLLAVLSWISEGVNSEDGPGEPPFRDDLVANWSLMWPDGSLHDIEIPCVDLTDGSIEFPAYAFLGQ